VSPTAVHKGSDATFTISARQNCRDTIVFYSISGKAQQGTDYTLSGTPGQVSIPANQTSAIVTLHALNNSRKKAAPATMKLQKGADYMLGPVKKATVSLLPN
jgi:hypothetical protein